MYIGVNYSQEVWHAYWSIKKCILHRPQKCSWKIIISLLKQEPWQTADTQDFLFVTCEFTRCRSPAVGRLLAALQGFAHVFYKGKQFELKRPRRSCTPRRLPSAFGRGSTETFPASERWHCGMAAGLVCESKQHRHTFPIVSEVLNVSRHSPGHLPATSNQAASTPLCLTACCQQLFADSLLTHMLLTLAPSVVSALR